MRLSKVHLQNFRSYCGRHELDLTSTADREMIVIFGENMSGKTALFLAIRWCLYGLAHGRRGELIRSYEPSDTANNYLLNSTAAAEEDWRMAVGLEWTHEGGSWRLDRTVEGDDAEGFLEADTTAHLLADDRVIPVQEIARYVNQQLHYDAAQFYFFDGELLSQYEKWLEDPQERDRRVRKAVELTVGTAALRLHEEMDTVTQEAEAAQARLVRRERKDDRLAAALSEARTRFSEIGNEIRGYEGSLEDLRTEAKRIEERHGALVEFSEERGKLNALETKISHDTQRRDEVVVRIERLVKAKYWTPLMGCADSLAATLYEELQELVLAPKDSDLQDWLEKSILDGRCQLCGHDLDDSASVHFERHFGHSDPPKADQSNPLEAVRARFDRLRLVELFREDDSLARLRDLDNDRLDAEADIYADTAEVADLRNAHSDRPRGDREEEMDRLIAINEEITGLSRQIEDARKERFGVKEQVTSLQAQVNRVEIDPAVQRRAQAGRIAVDATGAALIHFRERAREEVQRHASRIFRELVDETGYHGILIDNDYRVYPVDVNGSILPTPSAGGQQLVTLALIGGLNAAAVHDAPMIMDTPAGRIDKANRARIIRWIGTLGQQTILMVHSGEYTIEDIRATGVQWARLYQLSYDEFDGSRIGEVIL